MTQSNFIKQSTIDSTLIKAVIKGLGGWQQFKASSVDVVNHGANSGFGQFCYYSDTIAFSYKNRNAILKLLTDVNESIGECKSVTEFVYSFNCLREMSIGDEIGQALYGPKRLAIEQTQVMNALAWFALEEVCRAYSDVIEGV